MAAVQGEAMKRKPPHPDAQDVLTDYADFDVEETHPHDEKTDPDALDLGDVTPVGDPCWECGRPFVRIADSFPMPTNPAQAWREWGPTQCVGTQNGRWYWCRDGYLNDGGAVINYDRRKKPR